MNRKGFFLLYLLMMAFSFHGKEMKDTLWTQEGDRVILRYNIQSNGDEYTLTFGSPDFRTSEGSKLRKLCNNDFKKLKVVAFDRTGDYGIYKWKGLKTEAFTVPYGLRYIESSDGFYILGESAPMRFHRESEGNFSLRFPFFLALYEKKANYKLLSKLSPSLKIGISANKVQNTKERKTSKELIPVETTLEVGEDNNDITNILSSINSVREMLAKETRFPFSQVLSAQISSLITLKGQTSDADLIGAIDQVLRECDDKERELSEAQNAADMAEKAQQKAELAKEKQDEEKRREEAEEKARQQEEKQQKRTLWMIIGGVILSILGFIGNAVFKHFRDLSNQKNMREMQASLTRQAESEAKRRTREIIRNKAHQAVNKGRGEIRKKIQTQASSSGKNKKTPRKTI